MHITILTNYPIDSPELAASVAAFLELHLLEANGDRSCGVHISPLRLQHATILVSPEHYEGELQDESIYSFRTLGGQRHQ